MAVLHPFRALRPVPDKAEEVACVPYDVIDTDEARALASGRPLSFLHVIRPEIDLEEGIDEHADAVYEKGAANLHAYRNGEASVEEVTPCLYVYQLVMDGRAQTGIFGCVSTKDYDDDVILKHELTRPDKEDDRTRHILTQRAHAEPVMLTFRDHDGAQTVMDETVESAPLYDLMSTDGIRHTIWKVPDAEKLVACFREIGHLYVADGHHRCKAASRAAASFGDEEAPGEALYFPAVLFPMSNMKILAYNRVILKLPDSPDAFLQQLRDRFELHEEADPIPEGKGAISLYLQGSWYGLTLPEPASDSVVESLDVGRLSAAILKPMLGITDPRTDPNIGFVGGIRGTHELERLVDSGRAELAISMVATDIQELVDVSDAGHLMPPKSTWFEPKLRSGLLVHLF